ncbi:MULTISPECIES: hypothetical protein [Streptomyces]|uniref:hypothetical protein n=1 Tax=Streptomyces TaxID=1883 RepID=UPI003245FFA4
MHFSFDPVTTAYLADNAGVSLVDATRCEHDHPAFSLTLPGRWLGKAATAGLPAPLTVVLARCSASYAVGAFLAYLLVTEGTEAIDAFMDEARAAAEEVTPVLRHLHVTGQGCCEAAYRTQGREHTCKNGAQT